MVGTVTINKPMVMTNAKPLFAHMIRCRGFIPRPPTLSCSDSECIANYPPISKGEKAQGITSRSARKKWRIYGRQLSRFAFRFAGLLGLLWVYPKKVVGHA